MVALYATGFNAWGQLRFGDSVVDEEETDDISTFTCVLRRNNAIDLVRSFLSYTLGE